MEVSSLNKKTQVILVQSSMNDINQRALEQLGILEAPPTSE